MFLLFVLGVTLKGGNTIILHRHGEDGGAQYGRHLDKKRTRCKFISIYCVCRYVHTYIHVYDNTRMNETYT